MLIPALLNCAKRFIEKHDGQGRTNLTKLWQSAFGTFVEAILKEPELSVLLSMIEAFQASLLCAGPDSMGPSDLKQINQVVLQLSQHIYTRRRNREKLRHDPDFDDQDAIRIKKSNKRDDYLMLGLGEVVGKTFRHYKARFFPIFLADCGDWAKKLVNQPDSDMDLQVGLCVFADIIEHCQATSQQVIKYILPYFLKHAQHAAPGVRQAAAYSLGFCAQYGAAIFAPAVADTISALGKTISGKGSREAPYSTATDNAISAFSKVILYWHASIPQPRLESFLASYLSWLPTHDDLLEGPVIYGILLNLLEKIQDQMLGPNKQRLGHLLKVMAFVYNSRLSNDAVNASIVRAARRLKDCCPTEFNSFASALPAEDQEKLRKILAA